VIADIAVIARDRKIKTIPRITLINADQEIKISPRRCGGEQAMTIQIRDAALEARLKKQLETTGSSSVEELLLRLLESQEEQDRWLLHNREGISGKIQRGLDQLDRGEGIPEDRLDAYLADLKAKPE
jgi:hypothetical protein